MSSLVTSRFLRDRTIEYMGFDDSEWFDSGKEMSHFSEHVSSLSACKICSKTIVSRWFQSCRTSVEPVFGGGRKVPPSVFFPTSRVAFLPSWAGTPFFARASEVVTSSTAKTN